MDNFFQLISVLLIFVFVLAITYLTTRWMAGFQKSKSNNRNLKVLETINVGNNKFVSIVSAGKKYIVISVGKDEVNFLTELTEEEMVDLSFKDASTKEFSKEPFSAILDKFKKNQDDRSNNE